DLLNAVPRVVGYPGGAGLTLLGGDEHHAIRATRPVHGGRGGVLQHADGLDRLRVDVAESAGDRHAVHHDERVVARLERTGAADADRRVVAGAVVVGADLHARDAALERLTHAGGGDRRDLFRVDG